MGDKNKIKSTSSDAFGKRIKKKRSVGKIIVIVLAILLALMLLAAAAITFFGNKYIDDVLGLISYDTGESEWSFDESAGDDEDIKSFAPSDAPTPSEMPEYEVIEGLFDGDRIAEEYEEEVVNILLIGADTLNGNHARSDTMIIMSINPVKNRIVFTSLMRDSYVELPGRGYNRLNAAHAKGGPQYLIETIETNFGIDIDNYAKVDFTSFRSAIEAIGGVELTVNDVNYNYFYDWEGIEGLTQAQATDGTHTVFLNGEEALLYARTRKGHRVENSDFGRTLHQRDLLTQFLEGCKGASFEELHAVLQAVLPYVVTDMNQDGVKEHVLNALTYVSYNVDDARVPCAGSYENLTLESGAQVLNINVSANAKYVKAKIYG